MEREKDGRALRVRMKGEGEGVGEGEGEGEGMMERKVSKSMKEDRSGECEVKKEEGKVRV